MGVADFLRDHANVRAINAAIRRALAWRWGSSRGIVQILVLDDDASIRRVLERALDRVGHVVVSATSEHEALKLLGSDEPIGLIITSIDMRHADGLEVIASLRRDGRQIPILAISARNTREGWRDMAKERGANQTLPMPFSMKQLLHTVRELVGG